MAGSGRQNADSVLIAALAGGSTKQDAAKAARVAERTVYRRLEDPAFRRQVTQARAELVEGTVGFLTRVSLVAAVTLTQLLTAAQPPTVRLGAAKAILELGMKLREVHELEARIAALETATARRESDL